MASINKKILQKKIQAKKHFSMFFCGWNKQTNIFLPPSFFFFFVVHNIMDLIFDLLGKKLISWIEKNDQLVFCVFLIQNFFFFEKKTFLTATLWKLLPILGKKS